MAKNKCAVARATLERSEARVHLDPRRPGVVVPAHLATLPSTVLQIGFHTRIPIPDLVVDDEGISGTLSFSGEPFFCQVPWTAVFAIVGEDGKGTVWNEDAPRDRHDPPAPRHERECSICERARADVAYLVAAERVSICDLCIVAIYGQRTLWERIRSLVLTEDTPPAVPAQSAAYRDTSPTACSFCGGEHPRMTEGRRARMCRPCVILARDVLVERGVLSKR